MRTILIVSALFAAAAAVQAADAGKAAYDKSCKSCHGADGTANPAIAKMMKVDMRNLQSPEVQGESDDDLKKIIVDGKGKMRPMSSLAGSAGEIVAYVRSLKK